MDPHRILGTSAQSTPEEIIAAYRARARKHHPDAGGDEWAFILVERAYKYLTTGFAGNWSNDFAWNNDAKPTSSNSTDATNSRSHASNRPGSGDTEAHGSTTNHGTTAEQPRQAAEEAPKHQSSFRRVWAFLKEDFWSGISSLRNAPVTGNRTSAAIHAISGLAHGGEAIIRIAAVVAMFTVAGFWARLLFNVDVTFLFRPAWTWQFALGAIVMGVSYQIWNDYGDRLRTIQLIKWAVISLVFTIGVMAGSRKAREQTPPAGPTNTPAPPQRQSLK